VDQVRSRQSLRRLTSAVFLRCLAVVLCPALFTLFAALAASGQSPRPTDLQVKAAYLYNFGKFVRWPEGSFAEPVFTVCVLGGDPFEGALDQLTDGQTINGVPVKVTRIASPGGINGCRVLFIKGTEGNLVRSALVAARKTSVLTVSDAPEFLRQGGMIQFVLVQDHVRFEVNLNAVREGGLQLSAELLKVATKVVALNSSGVPQ